jgi:transmembrane 9 superfamily protein 2/4
LNTDFFLNRFHYYQAIQMAIKLLVLSVLIWLISRQLISEQSSSTDFDDFDSQRSFDKGWKVLQGDVFRPPSHPTSLSALTGSGCHLLLTLLLFCAISAHSSVDQPRNWPFELSLLLYVATSLIAGFVGCVVVNSFGVQKWLRVSLGASLSLQRSGDLRARFL